MSLSISSCSRALLSLCLVLVAFTRIQQIDAFPSSVNIVGLKVPLWGYPFDINEDTTVILNACQQDIAALFPEFNQTSIVCYDVEDDTDRITPTYRRLVYNMAQTSPLRISIAVLTDSSIPMNISIIYNEFYKYMQGPPNATPPVAVNVTATQSLAGNVTAGNVTAGNTTESPAGNATPLTWGDYSRIANLSLTLRLFNVYVPYLGFTGFPSIVNDTAHKPIVTSSLQVQQIQSLLESDPNTLYFCSSSLLNPQYVLICPNDNRYYAGQLGLGVAVTISILSLITCASCVYGIWNHHEQTRKRNNRRHVKKEIKQLLLGDHNTDFKQQRLTVWTPRLTYPWVISTYAVVAILFLPIGWYTTYQQLDLVDVSVRYDLACQSHINTNLNPFAPPTDTCQVMIPIPRDMFPPVYFYYQISNMYQNHKRYVNSLNDKQLRNDPSGPVYSDCDPMETFNNGDGALKFQSTYPNDWGKNLFPCGLIAQSLFTDQFIDPCVFTSDAVPCDPAALTFDRSGIAWKSDMDGARYSNNSRPSETRRNFYRGYEMNVNEDFVIWMRPGAMPTFSKLYGIIQTKLGEGEVLSVTVNNNYNVSAFGGHKHIVLSTMSRIGGRSMFLGVAYIVFGFLSLIMAFVFYARYRINTLEKEE